MFRPTRLEITAGTTVVWTNGGQVVHTVTAEDGSFDSGPIEAGERRAITFSTPRHLPLPLHAPPLHAG